VEPTKPEPNAPSGDAASLKAWDEFWLAATPRIFEWLRWAITLAAIQFVANRTRSPWAYIVLVVGYMALLNYYWAFFGKFRLGITGSSRAGRSVWAALVVGLGYGTYWFIKLLIGAIASAQP
jgi:hypothetical protein